MSLAVSAAGVFLPLSVDARTTGAEAAKVSASATTAAAAGASSNSNSSDQSVDYSFVQRDIASWEAVYMPVLEANGTLATIGGLPERDSANQDVAEAVKNIYALLTDTRKSSSILRTDKALMLYDVLNGNYTQKAVEAFLDHGFFTDYFQDLRRAGLIEETYRLPTHSYETNVMGETVTIPGENNSSAQSYRMLQTDSDYLDTEQLLSVARSMKDKKTIASLEKKIASFEDNFMPKYRKP